MVESSPEGAVDRVATTDRESLLLLSDPGDPGASAYCQDHLAGSARSLVVRTARSRPAADGGHEHPAVVLAPDHPTGAGGQPLESPDPPGPVAGVDDLPGLGATVDRYLTDWAADDHTPHVCVDSLGGLLERAPIRAGYRFLYVLSRRVERTDGVLHAHAQPHVHEEEILRTFYPLFDRVVAFSAASTPY